jgi:hypothetical protein
MTESSVELEWDENDSEGTAGAVSYKLNDKLASLLTGWFCASPVK